MKVLALNNFVCPVDGLPLFKSDKTFQCDNGHVFDVAREGYCNLLLVQQKSTLDPGDNKEMVAARRAFLDGGHFFPIAERLFEIVCEIIDKSKSDNFRIVDAGCGEGYYLNQLSKLATASLRKSDLSLAGCDISKWAIKAASKRSGDIAWAVAGNRQLPFEPSTVDLILSMFGFPDWENFGKIQPVEGRILLVDPGPDHLIELRKIIYPQVKASEGRLLNSAENSGYELKLSDRLKFVVDLENNTSIQNLLAMTPHTFKITPKAREDLQALKRLTVTADVSFHVLSKSK